MRALPPLLCLIVLLPAFGGCATVMRERTWHGKHFLYISCSGLTSSWQHCLEQAERSCGSSDFEVIARSNQAVEDAAEYPFGINPAGFSSRDTVVLCDPPGDGQQQLGRHFLRRFGRP